LPHFKAIAIDARYDAPKGKYKNNMNMPNSKAICRNYALKTSKYAIEERHPP
jgi:hypothetical protein